MTERTRAESRVAEMREAFDRTFALPPPDLAVDWVDLLAVSIAGRPYAFWMTDLRAIHPTLAVTPMATSTFEFRGLAQLDAQLVPVYDLRLLFGHASAEPPGCFVIAAHERVALAIDVFERHVRVPRDRLISRDAATAADLPFGALMVEVDAIARPLISVPVVLEAIRTRQGARGVKDRV